MSKTRQQKFPNTDTFTYHNQNPHNRFTTDCVVRAISMATGKPYNEVVIALAEVQCKTGFDPSEKNGYGKYLKSQGWVMHKQPRKADGRKYTGKEFCHALADEDFEDIDVRSSRRIIAHIGGHHLVAIVDWKVIDTWDSTNGCIGNFWAKI